MKSLVARAFIRGAIPQIALPIQINEKISIRSPESGPKVFLDDNAIKYSRQASFIIEIHDMESRCALPWAQAVISTLLIGSQSTMELFAFWSADVGSIAFDNNKSVLWGHNKEEIAEDTIRFAQEHTAVVESVLIPDEYSRVSNAIRLYFEALSFRSPEFALLGFVGALESLFSISTQELTFRLSLQLAKFLDDNTTEQRRFFHRAKKLYGTRSKIAHGDKLCAREEASAIEIVEHWTPEAEELARLSIKRLFDKSLVDYFNVKNKHESLLTELLFSDSLAKAIDAICRN